VSSVVKIFSSSLGALGGEKKPFTALTTAHRKRNLEAMPRNQTIRQSVSRAEVSRVGKRGAVVVPARLRRRFGIEEGSLVIAEERQDGILIRPAAAYPVEIYSPERKAEFLLSTAVDSQDYRAAVKEVRKMGLDPAKIGHYRPGRR
jgi:AbrB family looped-hinge helix DNA binding protein